MWDRTKAYIQFPTSVPTSHVVLSHLNQPFLPSISLNAPTLLGMSEAKPHPTALGFAHAFPQFDFEYDSDPHAKVGQLPKSMLDLEVALGLNWQEISTDSRKFTGGHKEQLENRTGMEVAVLAL
jgi:putative membrane protein